MAKKMGRSRLISFSDTESERDDDIGVGVVQYVGGKINVVTRTGIMRCETNKATGISF